jgi:hypothetical protein
LLAGHKTVTESLERGPTVASPAPEAAGASRGARSPSPWASARESQLVDDTCSGRWGGPEALRHCRPPEARCRLTAAQLGRLSALLQHGPDAYGLRGHLRPPVRFRPLYEWNLASRIIHAMSAAWAKPCPGARRSLPATLANATATKPSWPSKRDRSRGANHRLIDESGFYPLSSVTRTYAAAPVTRGVPALAWPTGWGGAA